MRMLSIGRMRVGAIGHLRRAIASCVASAFLLVTSCTNYVRVPESDVEVDSEKALGWRVIAGNVYYSVDRLQVTETHVILERVSSAYRIDGDNRYPRNKNIKGLQTPIVLALDEVTSIERIERDKLRSSLALVGVLAGAAFLLYLYALFNSFPAGT